MSQRLPACLPAERCSIHRYHFRSNRFVGVFFPRLGVIGLDCWCLTNLLSTATLKENSNLIFKKASSRRKSQLALIKDMILAKVTTRTCSRGLAVELLFNLYRRWCNIRPWKYQKLQTAVAYLSEYSSCTPTWTIWVFIKMNRFYQAQIKFYDFHYPLVWLAIWVIIIVI